MMVVVLIFVIIATWIYCKHEARYIVATGIKYLHGSDEYEYDPQKAITYFKKAAARGDEEGLFLAGYTLYCENLYRDINDEIKALWYLAGCKKKVPFASALLNTS